MTPVGQKVSEALAMMRRKWGEGGTTPHHTHQQVKGPPSSSSPPYLLFLGIGFLGVTESSLR